MKKENSIVLVGDNPVTWQDIVNVARKKHTLALTEQAWKRIHQSRHFVTEVATGQQLHYGINSGLGALCNVQLNPDELNDLSFHTLMSHACGVGIALQNEQVRAIMCTAVVNYSRGYSGISPDIVQRLILFLNQDITPVVPSQGSVGYLIHMAHIGLTLIGVGEVEFSGEKMPVMQAMQILRLSAITLGPKDGLSLVNGTPSMTGMAALCIDDCHKIALWADISSAMTFDALGGQASALTKPLMQLKTYLGLQTTTHNINLLLCHSAHLAAHQGRHLQDALSLRSIPHVHGACRDQLTHAQAQINQELNSVSDNPIIIEEHGTFSVHSQAHPHGASVAMACDILSIAICEWSSIAERRIHRLVNPYANHLPPFLIRKSGVKSGMMIAQYTASSLAADNKRLSYPAVVDNYITSGIQEDHLSFGESAALKLTTAINNCFYILSIELIMAAQAFDLIEHQKFGLGNQKIWEIIRKIVPEYDEHHPLHHDIEKLFIAIKGDHLANKVINKIKDFKF